MLTENEKLKSVVASLTEKLETAKRENENQIQQIMRLNNMVVQSEEEKQTYENQIHQLEEKNREMEKSMSDPSNYYQRELSKLIDEKSILDEQFELQRQELTQLKAVLSEKMQGISSLFCYL